MNDALFNTLWSVSEPQLPTVDVTFDGAPLAVPMASSVAAALLAAGVKRFRESPVSGTPRGPYCMMGVCFECLLEIDGVPNQQGCLVPVQAGLVIRTQASVRAVDEEGALPAMALAHAMEMPDGL